MRIFMVPPVVKIKSETALGLEVVFQSPHHRMGRRGAQWTEGESIGELKVNSGTSS
jgi:hypothetical protein